MEYSYKQTIHFYEDAAREQYDEEEAMLVIARQLAEDLSEKRITVRLVKTEPSEAEIYHFRNYSTYPTDAPYKEYMLEVGQVEERSLALPSRALIIDEKSIKTRLLIRELLRRVGRLFTPDHVRQDVNEFNDRYRWQDSQE
jgi:hypothetical protein